MSEKVVIVGGGFAGLQAARRLKSAPVEITLIDQRNFHLFQPLLYQVATAALDPSDISHPIRAIFRSQDNVKRVLLARVASLDVANRAVCLDDGTKVEWDKLILATGATHSYFGKDHWSSHAPGLKTIEDALDIRKRILTAFEEAERFPEQQDVYLTFVIVGAGPTGVELAGAVMEVAVHALAREYDTIDPSRARVILIEGAENVLPVYPQELSKKAQRQLEGLGVVVKTGVLAQEIDADGVTLNDGTRLASKTVLWAAGVKASSLGASLGCPLDRNGRVIVGPDLSIPDRPDIFVAGDLASIECEGQKVPGVAPAAIQSGHHVAKQILGDLSGLPRTPFKYKDKGSLATIGRARAVADFGRFRFGGFMAWITWMLVHVFFLIGFRNRAFVMLSWAWNWFTFRRGSRLITHVKSKADDESNRRIKT